MSVMSTSEGPQEAETSPAIVRIVRVQRCGANQSSDNLHDSHCAGNDRSFHKRCRDSPLLDSIIGGNLSPFNKYLDC